MVWCFFVLKKEVVKSGTQRGRFGLLSLRDTPVLIDNKTEKEIKDYAQK